MLKIIVKQADGSLKVQNRCSKYRIMLERKEGKIYSELPEQRGDKPHNKKDSSTGLTNLSSKKKVQKEVGKSRETLNKWAKEAEIDEEVLEGRPWF